MQHTVTIVCFRRCIFYHWDWRHYFPVPFVFSFQWQEQAGGWSETDWFLREPQKCWLETTGGSGERNWLISGLVKETVWDWDLNNTCQGKSAEGPGSLKPLKLTNIMGIHSLLTPEFHRSPLLRVQLFSTLVVVWSQGNLLYFSTTPYRELWGERNSLQSCGSQRSSRQPELKHECSGPWEGVETHTRDLHSNFSSWHKGTNY